MHYLQLLLILLLEGKRGEKMLGVYDYTVILTYVSLMVSIGGMDRLNMQ